MSMQLRRLNIFGTCHADGQTCAPGRAMSRLAKLFVLFVSLIWLATWGGNAYAAIITSTAAGGNWNAATTWVGGVVPGTADTAIIATTGAGAVAVNVATRVNALTINAGATLNASTVRLRVNTTTSVSGAINFTGAVNAAHRFSNAVTINAGGAWTDTSSSTFNFRAGGITNNGGTFTGGTGVYEIRSAAQTIGGTSPISIPSLLATTTITNTGVLTVGTALTGTTLINNSATAILNLGGTSAITTLTATFAGNTVNYTGAAQIVKATAYSNLGLSGSGVKTLTGVTTVGGNLTMSGTATATTAAALAIGGNLSVGAGTTLTVGAFNIGVTGTTTVSGTLAHSSAVGTKTYTGALTINAGGALTNAGNTAISYGGGLVNNGAFTSGTAAQTFTNGGLTHNGTAFTAGTGAFTFSTNPQAINCATALTIPSITTAIALTNNCNLTVTTALAGAGSFINAATGTLNIGFAAAPTVTALTATAVGNTVNYNMAGAQVVRAVAYHHLGLGTSGAKTMGATTIAGNFTMSGAATTAPTGALTVGGNFTIGTGTTFTAGAFNHTVSGNFDATGTFTPGAGTVTLNGAAAQTISGTSPVNFNNLTVTNAANPNITLATNVTVAGTLTGTVTLTSTCPTDYTLTSTTPAQVLHSCPPTSVVSSINLANASPTSAATVAWTVTFNKSVTGVDATAFTLAPTGLSGAYITTVTGSGATWTVTANTGIGSGTLGLNQTGPGAVVPTLTGTFTGQIYTITATPALAEYRMDEASWNGTANEVADSSGNGNHAQAFNSANTEDVSRAIPGSPGTCRNGVFDNGTTITQGYVQTPLPNLTTDFTVTAWIRTTNNTIGAQRILIDDQGTAPGTGYGISLGEAGTGRLRFYSRGITPVILDSTYTVANNTWYFVAAVADITNKKRTIYVFDAAGTLLNSTPEAAAFTGTWGTDGGPVSIGAETNASAETPAANHFKGNLDEVSVYQKVLSQAALAAIATQTHVCPINVPDHLEIQSSGSGLTCAASTLTIKACADAAIPCVIPYTLGVSGTLSATGTPTVNWDGTTGGAAGAGFVIPNGSSTVTKDVQVATAGSVVFGITSPSPVPTNATACNFGTPACTFTANTAGFIFSDTSSPGNAYTIPAQVSGIATPTLYLRAVQASTTNPAVCTPAIIGQTTGVNMGYACNNPAACQAGNLTTINATAVAPGGTAVNLTFDANGSAPITARYDDVGQITLNASKTITPFGGATAVTLNGSSNAFVVKPDHFDLSAIQQTAAPNLANPAAADATGAKFVKAGEQFSVTVTAKNALGATTANYGQESTAESVKLTSVLVSGLGLTGNPAIGGTFGAFTNGVATGTAFTWDEAGIITLTPSVADADYLGAGDATGTTSGNVGRFYAAQFALSGGVIANRTGLAGCSAPAGCGTFTYMGEQMSAVFNLTAKAVDGTTTLQNYNYSATAANNFAKLDPTAAGNPLVLGAVDTGAPRTVATLDTTTYGVASGSFAGGIASITAPFAVTRGGSASGPFGALDVGIAPADSDGAALAALDLAVNAGGTPNTHGRVGGTKARYGRMKLSNAHGSELLPLTIAVTAQYWNGATYVANTLDNSSTFAATDVIFGNYTKNLNAANYPNSGATAVTPASVVFVNGAASYKLAKAGAGNNGSVDMTVSAISAYLPSNTARATFGVYKGNNEFIYLREAY